MKTIQRFLLASALCAALVFSATSLTAVAQLSDFDASLAFFDGASPMDTPAEPLLDEPTTRTIAELRSAMPDLSATDWRAYGDALHSGLLESNDGLQSSALQHIIAYGDRLQLGNSTVVEVMKLYRDAENDQIRRMAVVALGELDSELAVDYLERSWNFEKNDSVKRTIAAVVNAHQAS